MIQTLRVMDEQNPQGHITERMAEVIVKRIQKQGQCSIMDIKAMGFSLNEIARYWPDACHIAEREHSKWRMPND